MNHNFYTCLISYHFSHGFFGVDLVVWDLFISLMILTLVVWYELGFMIFRSGFCFWGFIYVWHYDICVMKLLYTSLWFSFLFFFSGLLLSLFCFVFVLFFFFFFQCFFVIYITFFFGAKNNRNFDWYYGIIQVKTELRANSARANTSPTKRYPQEKRKKKLNKAKRTWGQTTTTL